MRKFFIRLRLLFLGCCWPHGNRYCWRCLSARTRRYNEKERKRQAKRDLLRSKL